MQIGVWDGKRKTYNKHYKFWFQIKAFSSKQGLMFYVFIQIPTLGCWLQNLSLSDTQSSDCTEAKVFHLTAPIKDGSDLPDGYTSAGKHCFLKINYFKYNGPK